MELINEDVILMIEQKDKVLQLKSYVPKENELLKNHYNNAIKEYKDALKSYPKNEKQQHMRTDNNDRIFIQTVKQSYRHFYESVKKIDPLYVANKNYVAVISSSYEDFYVYSPDELGKSFDSLYNNYEYYLKHLRISYLHRITKDYIGNTPTIKAFSHRKIGFNTDRFLMDKNFKIDVNTNFGYGGSSYFTLKMLFKDIPIIPYSRVIYHRYANAYTYISFTNEYGVVDESWRSCFRFVTEEVNQFNQKGETVFIKTHIKESIDELMTLLDKVLYTNLIYFIDNHRLNNFLDYNQKYVVYQYEHLINNVNPDAINTKAFNELLDNFDVFTEKNNLYNFFHQNKQTIQSILPDFVKEHNDPFLKDKYAYAISYLISQRYQNAYFNTYDTYSNPFGSIIDEIIPNHKAIIYKYDEKDMLDYRLERMGIILKHVEVIKSLNEIINSKYYVSKFKSYSSIIIEQNKEYLRQLINKIKSQKAKVDTIKAEYDNALLKVQEDKNYKSYQFYANIFDTIEQWFNRVEYDENKQLLVDRTKMIELINEVKENYQNLVRINQPATNYLSIDENYGNNLSSEWSVGAFRTSYLFYKQQQSDKQSTYYDALIESMKLLKHWGLIFKELELVLIKPIEEGYETLLKEIHNNLSCIKESTEKINQFIDHSKKHIRTIQQFRRHFEVTNLIFTSINETYNILMDPIRKIKIELDQNTTILNQMITDQKKKEDGIKYLQEESEKI